MAIFSSYLNYALHNTQFPAVHTSSGCYLLYFECCGYSQNWMSRNMSPRF